ncbi:kinase-like protein [Lyophyllum atratum]|nr:kinase-like protein [Lyophyllum atratum]KAF8059809.1 kinase-like protein [Lyophyllum atratum]
MADLPPGLLRIGGKYRLKKKIGSGSFGDVFSATNVITGVDVAVKLEDTEVDNPKLREEWNIYKAIGQGEGIPKVFWFGLECGYRSMVMSLLGPSLADLFETCHRQFSVKTVCMLAIQLISRLEFIHNRNYVHRDIKPDNLLAGPLGHKSESLIYLVDYGLANQYRDAMSFTHIPYMRQATLTGTIRYLSVNGHRGVELTRRDDLESLAYVLIFFLRGSLPWQGLEATSRKKKSALIMKKKLDISATQLCRNLPNAFAILLDYSRSLAFDAPPDYTYLRAIFHDVLHDKGYAADHVFDWDRSTCAAARRGPGHDGPPSADTGPSGDSEDTDALRIPLLF